MTKKINLETLRHSTAHILAAAILEMFPEAKFGMGPAIENGFYYDFELPRTLIPEDLPILEEKMKAIIKANHKFEQAEISAKEAKADFKKLRQDYKLELIDDLEKENQNICVYKADHFVDLCAGPHIESTGGVNPEAFKLTKISGAYWKNDEKNKQLQRIYGIVFETKKELREYLQMIAEAEKRDHKKLGKELDLFSFHPEAPGSAFWHPNGMVLRVALNVLGKGLKRKYNYQDIQTPALAKNTLWKTSGHWDHYKDGMFHFKVDNDIYCLKPMDCPFNIKIYQTKQRSYRELPIRYTETGRVHRKEKSGELNGLFRVQTITQDDAHVFCRESQIEQEIATLLKMIDEYYTILKIKPNFYISTRPDDYMGDLKTWNKAEEDLMSALRKEGLEFGIKEKDGVFYGPKIDVDIEDALGRRWQMATIQLDFQLPQRFKIDYINEKGEKETPVMIHAAIFGSYERFIGILIEHFGGKFPLWISPIQIKIIPVSEKFNKYAQKVCEALLNIPNLVVRAEIDATNESLGKRIREAEKQKIPYMLVVGEKEMQSDSVAVRSRDDKKQEVIKLDEFVKKIKQEIEEKK